ncbi:Hypothetical predicted protein [Cloeon dipterum]|uniref:Rho GTPase-activating protein 12 n=1 Tax=Cloeon dipterum TaxID=197152 RepID=A0A8S1DKG4_9INSE|nr:Hypothetical predicted protein [Cloeon dipterum]
MEGGENMFVRVLYNFDYTTKDGRLVSIRQGEKLLLLKHTNQDWWQVLRNPESKPFYVPAAYVRECPPAYIPGPEYLNIASGVCCHDERRQLTSVLRNELITGNYNLRDKHQLFNQHVCSADKGPTGESKKSAGGVRRNYSVVGPGGKKPVPSPRINVLSKSLETLAEEINFKPWNTPISSSKVIEQTSDYNTPSPDYLDSSESDMFWRKNTAAAGSSVQRSSSFKFRSFRRDNNEQPARQDDSDSVASRSLESLVDSGAEACSSSSYEWDKSPDENRELLRRISIPHAALAFKNQTYHSTDDEGSDGEHTVVRGRPRSSSDTGLGVGGQQEKRGTQLSRSESHKEQPRPLAALKRNQKVVGCRRRPAILCIPSKNSSNSPDDDDDDEVPPFNVAPRPLQHLQPLDPPTPDSREKPQRVLHGGWSEFRTENGRVYYFHSITGIKSWKPPRTRNVGNNREHEDTRKNEQRSSQRSPKEGTKSRSPSPAAVDLVLPPGWDEYYDREERQVFYIHKPTGAKAHQVGRDPPVPGNVSEWLHNLRRNTDSSEVEDELRHKVESAAAASGITASARLTSRKSAAPKPDIAAKPRPPSVMKKIVDSEKAAVEPPPSDKQQGGWKENPLFTGIEPQQVRRPDAAPGRAFQSLCDEARRVSTDLLKELDADDQTALPEMVGLQQPRSPTKQEEDQDLEKLTQEALSLVDEALIEHAVNKRLTLARIRTNSGSSDVSDEVFVSCNSEPGTIFDHDGAPSHPQPPPRRKKVLINAPPPVQKTTKPEERLPRVESLNRKQPTAPTRPPPEAAKRPPSIVQPMVRQRSFVMTHSRASSAPFATLTPRKTMPPLFAADPQQRPPSPKQPPPSKLPPPPLERKSSLQLKESLERKKPSKQIETPQPIVRKSLLKNSDAKVANPPTYGKFSVHVVERKTYYPEITKDSVVLVPAVSKEMKDLLVTTAQESDDDAEQSSLEHSFRSRKGSNGSDIVAWKNDIRTCSNADEEDEVYYTAKSAPNEWFSSSDNEGRLYFFAENSNESSWSLPQSPAAPKSAPPPPETAPPPRTSTPLARVAPQGVPPVLKKLEQQLQQAADDLSPTEETEPLRRPRKNMGPCLLPPLPNSRAAKSQSMIVVPDVKTPMSESQTDAPSSPGPWASLESSGATILKEGQITRTKVMESKKKVKKNWSPAWALLTSDCMYFFKDEKSFKAMKNSTGGHPELCVPLNQSCFQEGDKNLSSKKNTFLIGTDTNQVLCQEEQIRDKESWFNQISLAKKCMPENHLNTAPRYPVLSRESSPLPPAVGGPPVGSVSPEMSKNNSLNRNKSVKIKKDSAESNEDLSTENHTKIKAGLRKFFKRRPTMESLVKKGIIQDEPAFGSTLSKLCQSQSPGSNGYIPKFVLECINAIEKKPENLKTDGIYRASGNLSQVQKIRLQVDQNNLAVLDQEEEVHVLTGALKLFFRELKEPLIPFGLLDAALTASNNRDKSEKIRQFRGLVQQMPKENRATLKFLLEHLLRVVDNHTHNRMHISNLAIVFGPTLMWPKEESCNMALELMQQNYVIECLLEEFDSIFN